MSRRFEQQLAGRLTNAAKALALAGGQCATDWRASDDYIEDRFAGHLVPRTYLWLFAAVDFSPHGEGFAFRTLWQPVL